MRQLKISKQVTNRNETSLDMYLHDVGRISLITTETEVELAHQISLGDPKALEHLVRSNLRFVISVAKQYQNQGLSLPDLISEGNLGLIKAAQRFDETRGFKFISYAVWWIRQSILQAISEQSRIVRLPLNKIGSINKSNKTAAALEQQFEREPTAEELSMVLGQTPEEILSLMRTATRQLSLDAPLNTDENMTMYDMILTSDKQKPDFEHLDYSSLRIDIQRVLSTLPEKEAKVIRLFFGLDDDVMHSLDEIGSTLGISRERARQIKDKALKQLRQIHRSRHLKNYL